MNVDEHAEILVSFHRKLTDGGISSDAAGALTVGLSQALLSGLVPEESKADKVTSLNEAAEAKRAERERQLR